MNVSQDQNSKKNATSASESNSFGGANHSINKRFVFFADDNACVSVCDQIKDNILPLLF